jgi:hypothetical protein
MNHLTAQEIFVFTICHQFDIYKKQHFVLLFSTDNFLSERLFSSWWTVVPQIRLLDSYIYMYTRVYWTYGWVYQHRRLSLMSNMTFLSVKDQIGNRILSEILFFVSYKRVHAEIYFFFVFVFFFLWCPLGSLTHCLHQ